MSVTSVRLQDDLDKSLNELALKSNRSKNWIINQAIKEFIEHQAIEEQRWLETLSALESVRSGISIPSERVENWLASWGKDKEMEVPE